MNEIYEMNAFKNDLMQLVINCQFDEFRPKVGLSSINDVFILGLEALLWILGDQTHHKLLSGARAELPTLS